MSIRANAIEQAAADWLARRDSGHWTPADADALEHWLAADSAHRVAFLRLQASWEESARLQALGAGWRGGVPPRGHWQASPHDRREQMLQALAPRPRAARHPRRPIAWLATAATLAACALLAHWSWRSHTHVDTAQFRTVLGEVRSQPLADGSQAILGSDSRIEVRLSRRARDINLAQGEAIFDVRKDAHRPFSVAAGGYHAVAVGTRFSVRRGSDDLRVVVTEGTVRLDAPAAGGNTPAPVLLPAGSVALVHGKDVLVRSLPLAEAQRLLDWRNGLLAFRDTALTEVIAEFNRYNARKLVIADPAAGTLRVGGNFRWDNEEGFAKLLELGFPVRAVYRADRIELHSR